MDSGGPDEAELLWRYIFQEVHSSGQADPGQFPLLV